MAMSIFIYFQIGRKVRVEGVGKISNINFTDELEM